MPRRWWRFASINLAPGKARQADRIGRDGFRVSTMTTNSTRHLSHPQIQQTRQPSMRSPIATSRKSRRNSRLNLHADPCMASMRRHRQVKTPWRLFFFCNKRSFEFWCNRSSSVGRFSGPICSEFVERRGSSSVNKRLFGPVQPPRQRTRRGSPRGRQPSWGGSRQHRCVPAVCAGVSASAIIPKSPIENSPPRD